eukprot:1236562-Pleurochrysis_carterae.AAC.2
MQIFIDSDNNAPITGTPANSWDDYTTNAQIESSYSTSIQISDTYATKNNAEFTGTLSINGSTINIDTASSSLTTSTIFADVDTRLTRAQDVKGHVSSAIDVYSDAVGIALQSKLNALDGVATNLTCTNLKLRSDGIDTPVGSAAIATVFTGDVSSELASSNHLPTGTQVSSLFDTRVPNQGTPANSWDSYALDSSIGSAGRLPSTSIITTSQSLIPTSGAVKAYVDANSGGGGGGVVVDIVAENEPNAVSSNAVFNHVASQSDSKLNKSGGLATNLIFLNPPKQRSLIQGELVDTPYSTGATATVFTGDVASNLASSNHLPTGAQINSYIDTRIPSQGTPATSWDAYALQSFLGNSCFLDTTSNVVDNTSLIPTSAAVKSYVDANVGGGGGGTVVDSVTLGETAAVSSNAVFNHVRANTLAYTTGEDLIQSRNAILQLWTTDTSTVDTSNITLYTESLGLDSTVVRLNNQYPGNANTGVFRATGTLPIIHKTEISEELVLVGVGTISNAKIRLYRYQMRMLGESNGVLEFNLVHTGVAELWIERDDDPNTSTLLLSGSHGGIIENTSVGLYSINRGAKYRITIIQLLSSGHGHVISFQMRQNLTGARMTPVRPFNSNTRIPEYGCTRLSTGRYRFVLLDSIESNAFSVFVQPYNTNTDLVITKVTVEARNQFIVSTYNISNSSAVDCGFDVQVVSRGDIKFQTKVDENGQPILETNYGIPVAVAPSVAPHTFSSWNIPFAGPTAADAMNESLPSDDGTYQSVISMYYTNDYNDPDTVSTEFVTYNPGSNTVSGYGYTVHNQYGTPYDANNSIPWAGKYGGTGMTDPNDVNTTLSGVESGDISTHAPQSNTGGLVFKQTIKNKGVYEIHDSYLMPTQPSFQSALSVFVKSSGVITNVVPLQSWTGASTINSQTFTQTHADKDIVKSKDSGLSIGLLQSDDQIYYVISNFNGWSGDGSLLRFRTSCTPV